MTASAPLFVLPVLGFRVWKLTIDGSLLPRAVSALEHLNVEPWRRGRNDARCVYVGISREPHAVPGERCDCGLHAHHEVGQLRRPSRTEDLLLGAVVAWGALQVHRTGFRAEHAQVVALAAPESSRLAAPARAAAERYGVPLVAYDELDRYVATHGAQLPNSVRPTRWPRLRRGYNVSSLRRVGHIPSARR